MAKLLYQGHGSYRITAKDGQVVYVDPYAGKGYDAPADLILVTHGHRDHCATDLCAKKQDCRIITHEEALAGGKHNSFDLGWIKIQSVEAGGNLAHSPKKCVGYVITVDGKKIYCSGDTSKIKAMNDLTAMKLDYALFCGDGVFNMGPKEAAECAAIIGAKHNIIIHLKPMALFDRGKAEKWTAPNKLIIEPEQEIEL